MTAPVAGANFARRRRAIANDNSTLHRRLVSQGCPIRRPRQGVAETVPPRNTRSEAFRVCPPGSCHARLSRKLLTCVLLAVVSRPSLPAPAWARSRCSYPWRTRLPTALPWGPWLADGWHQALRVSSEEGGHGEAPCASVSFRLR
jgi:hypothetical protein